MKSMRGKVPVCYRFEGFEVDVRTRQLRGSGGQVLPLTAKAFDVLCVLLERRHELVAKNDLITAVWPGRVVEENNLTQAVSAVRRALGTGGGEHRYIVTEPGRGYRFVANVSVDEPVPEGPMRPFRHRRIGYAVGLLALALAGGWVATRPTRLTSPPSAPAVVPLSLAVMEFMPPPAREADPMDARAFAEGLVQRLGRSPDLRVHSLAAADRVAGAHDPIRVGQALGAAFVLDGSWEAAGPRPRLRARLRRVTDGALVWTQLFEPPSGSPMLLHDRLANGAATALGVRLPPASGAPSACDGIEVGATRALVRAQFALSRRAPQMTSLFHDAIRLDPTCARAYAGLAMAYLALLHQDRDPRELHPLARAAIERGLQLDPQAAEVQLAHGRYLQLHDWDWAGAEAALRRAIALQPSLAEAHYGLAHLLVATRRFEEGLEAARTARSLDPLSPMITTLEAGFLGAAGRTEEAQAQVTRALQLEPGFWVALKVRGGLRLAAGDPNAALRDLELAARNSHRNSLVLGMLSQVQMAAGHPMAAASTRAELLARARQGHVAPSSLAAAHVALGDIPAALDAMDRAHAQRDIRIALLGVDARWNRLRREERFRTRARALGLSVEPAVGWY